MRNRPSLILYLPCRRNPGVVLRIVLVSIFSWLLTRPAAAQTDTLPRADTLVHHAPSAGPAGVETAPGSDTAKKKPAIRKPRPLVDTARVAAGTSRADTSSLRADTTRHFATDVSRYSDRLPREIRMRGGANAQLADNPWFNFTGKPEVTISETYTPPSYDIFFYVLIVILFYFAIIRLLFAKYIANIMTLFFRASMRHAQLRDQVLQATFPSLLLNLLFVISGGLYATFVIRYYNPGLTDFWPMAGIIAASIAGLYLAKFLILKLVGWIFHQERAVDTYLFVVFMANKVVGIFLLPFIVILSFSGPLVTEIAITISFVMLAVFLVYRVAGGYSSLSKEIKMTGIHYFLYLCAFEIAPLILIYKVLLANLEKAF